MIFAWIAIGAAIGVLLARMDRTAIVVVIAGSLAIVALAALVAGAAGSSPWTVIPVTAAVVSAVGTTIRRVAGPARAG